MDEWKPASKSHTSDGTPWAMWNVSGSAKLYYNEHPFSVSLWYVTSEVQYTNGTGWMGLPSTWEML